VSDGNFLVLVNGEARTIDAQSTVAHLVSSLGLERRRVAVAVNRNVIPRSAFDSSRLANGDRIEILEAVGGG
jgi:sulfur carrier protein